MAINGNHRKMALAALLCTLVAIHEVFGLQCYKGLGNSSKKHEQEVMECPEGKFYVCVKMFGGGMGDQIRRYCEDISREEYTSLQEKEELKETEYPSEDPACYETVHNGREVKKCICTHDLCNGSTSTSFNVAVMIFTLVTSLYLHSNQFLC